MCVCTVAVAKRAVGFHVSVCVIEKLSAHLLSSFSIQNIIKWYYMYGMYRWHRYEKSKDQLTGKCVRTLRYVTFMISTCLIWTYLWACVCGRGVLLLVFGIHSMWNKLKSFAHLHLLFHTFTYLHKYNNGILTLALALVLFLFSRLR